MFRDPRFVVHSSHPPVHGVRRAWSTSTAAISTQTQEGFICGLQPMMAIAVLQNGKPSPSRLQGIKSISTSRMVAVRVSHVARASTIVVEAT